MSATPNPSSGARTSAGQGGASAKAGGGAPGRAPGAGQPKPKTPAKAKTGSGGGKGKKSPPRPAQGWAGRLAQAAAEAIGDWFGSAARPASKSAPRPGGKPAARQGSNAAGARPANRPAKAGPGATPAPAPAAATATSPGPAARGAPAASAQPGAEAAAPFDPIQFEVLYGLVQGNDFRVVERSVRAAMKVGFDINSPTPVGQRLIHAAACGRDEMCSALAALGADLDVVDNFGNSPLHVSARNRAKACGALLRAGARADLVNKQGETPLQIAIAAGYTNAVEALLRVGPYTPAPDAPPESQGRANPDQRLANGRYPLHLAASLCPDPAATLSMQLLIEAKAKVDARDAERQTPLHVGAIVGSLQAVELLLDAGADPTARDAHGQTPAQAANTAGSAGALDGVAACISALKYAEAEKEREILAAAKAEQEAARRAREGPSIPPGGVTLLRQRLGERGALFKAREGLGR